MSRLTYHALSLSLVGSWASSICSYAQKWCGCKESSAKFIYLCESSRRSLARELWAGIFDSTVRKSYQGIFESCDIFIIFILFFGSLLITHILKVHHQSKTTKSNSELPLFRHFYLFIHSSRALPFPNMVIEIHLAGKLSCWTSSYEAELIRIECRSPSVETQRPTTSSHCANGGEVLPLTKYRILLFGYWVP